MADVAAALDCTDDELAKLVKKEEEDDGGSSQTAASTGFGRAGPIPVLASPFSALAGSSNACPAGLLSPESSLASSKDSTAKETLPPPSAMQSFAAHSSMPGGAGPAAPNGNKPQQPQQQQQRWRPVIPLGRAASLTKAMSIGRAASGGSRKQNAGDSVNSARDCLANISPAAISAALPAPVSAGVAMPVGTGGGAAARGSSGGRARLQGVHGLADADRRHQRRRDANRDSARRVRAKASATIDELTARMAQLETHNAQLLSRLSEVEADRAQLQSQVAVMGEQLSAAALETNRLRAEQEAQRRLQQEQAETAAAAAASAAAAAQARSRTPVPTALPGDSMPYRPTVTGAPPITSGHAPLHNSCPTISIARRGITVTSAVAPARPPQDSSAGPGQGANNAQRGSAQPAGRATRAAAAAAAAAASAAAAQPPMQLQATGTSASAVQQQLPLPQQDLAHPQVSWAAGAPVSPHMQMMSAAGQFNQQLMPPPPQPRSQLAVNSAPAVSISQLQTGHQAMLQPQHVGSMQQMYPPPGSAWGGNGSMGPPLTVLQQQGIPGVSGWNGCGHSDSVASLSAPVSLQPLPAGNTADAAGGIDDGRAMHGAGAANLQPGFSLSGAMSLTAVGSFAPLDFTMTQASLELLNIHDMLGPVDGPNQQQQMQ